MGLFDMFANKAGNQIGNAIKQGVQKSGNNSEKITFEVLPETYEQFISLPQASMQTPFQTAAMTVLAFCFYPMDKELSLKMLDFLRGPRPLSQYEKQFIRDRFMDKDYVPRSYFEGATPDNDYQPKQPYSIIVSDNPYSYQNEGMAKLFLKSGGADSSREIVLRKAKDGKWYLWDQFILSDIRKPESSNPWA